MFYSSTFVVVVYCVLCQMFSSHVLMFVLKYCGGGGGCGCGCGYGCVNRVVCHMF